jgi:hypothetical protein
MSGPTFPPYYYFGGSGHPNMEDYGAYASTATNTGNFGPAVFFNQNSAPRTVSQTVPVQGFFGTWDYSLINAIASQTRLATIVVDDMQAVPRASDGTCSGFTNDAGCWGGGGIPGIFDNSGRAFAYANMARGQLGVSAFTEGHAFWNDYNPTGALVLSVTTYASSIIHDALLYKITPAESARDVFGTLSMRVHGFADRGAMFANSVLGFAGLDVTGPFSASRAELLGDGFYDQIITLPVQLYDDADGVLSADRLFALDFFALLGTAVDSGAIFDYRNTATLSVDFPVPWTSASGALLVAAAVPEAGSLALLGIALAGLGLSRRRKKT